MQDNMRKHECLKRKNTVSDNNQKKESNSSFPIGVDDCEASPRLTI